MLNGAYLSRVQEEVASNLLLEVDLRSQGLGPQEAHKIASSLSASGNTSVTGLNLYNNSILVDGAKAIARSLKSSSIKMLDLSGNNIGPSVLDLATALRGTRLTSLKLRNNSMGLEGLISLMAGLKGSNVEDLDVGGNSIGVPGVTVLALALKAVPLTSLGIRDNAIGDEGLKVLTDSLLGSRMTALDLSNNSIQGAGVVAVAEGLTKPPMAILNMSGNPIGDTGAKVMATWLKQSVVTSLSLWGTSIGARGTIALASVLKDFPLTRLELTMSTNSASDPDPQTLEALFAGLAASRVVSLAWGSHSLVSHSTKDWSPEVQAVLGDILRTNKKQRILGADSPQVPCTRRHLGTEDTQSSSSPHVPASHLDSGTAESCTSTVRTQQPAAAPGFTQAVKQIEAASNLMAAAHPFAKLLRQHAEAAPEVPLSKLKGDLEVLRKAVGLVEKVNPAHGSHGDLPPLQSVLDSFADFETAWTKGAEDAQRMILCAVQSLMRPGTGPPDAQQWGAVAEALRQVAETVPQIQALASTMKQSAELQEVQVHGALRRRLMEVRMDIYQTLVQQLTDKKSWRLDGSKLERELKKKIFDLSQLQEEIQECEVNQDIEQREQLQQQELQAKEDIRQLKEKRRALDRRFHKLAQEAIEAAPDSSSKQKVTEVMLDAVNLPGAINQMMSRALQDSGSSNLNPLVELVQRRTLVDYDEDWEDGPSPSKNILFKRLGSEKLAIKRVQLDLSGQDSFRSFCYVAAIHATSEHPNLLPIRAVFFEEDKDHGLFGYMEMERLPHTLGNWPVTSIREVWRAVKQMVKVVLFLHSKDVKHGDLKPSNFLVTEESRVKLIDFELARGQREMGDTSIIRSLPKGRAQGFTAPELLREDGTRDMEKDLTKEADIFSLGRTVEAFVAGVERRLGDAVTVDFRKLKEIANSMCQRDPSQRPTASQALEAVSQINLGDLDRELVPLPSYWSQQATGASFKLVLCEDLEPFRRLLESAETFGGRDQRRAGAYSRLELAGAWRVENRSLYAEYASKKNSLRGVMKGLQTRGFREPRVNLKAPLQEAMQHLEPESFDETVREVLVLHGTRYDILSRILHEGFNPNLAGIHGAMFGKGTYAAEDPEKADQYTTPGKLPEAWPRPAGESGEALHYIIGVRAMLGYSLTTEKDHVCLKNRPLFVGPDIQDVRPEDRLPAHIKRYDRGEMRELRMMDAVPGVDLSERPFYHSLIAQPSRDGWIHRHREFVFFHGERLYPEYVIAYRRV